MWILCRIDNIPAIKWRATIRWQRCCITLYLCTGPCQWWVCSQGDTHTYRYTLLSHSEHWRTNWEKDDIYLVWILPLFDKVLSEPLQKSVVKSYVAHVVIHCKCMHILLINDVLEFPDSHFLYIQNLVVIHNKHNK